MSTSVICPSCNEENTGGSLLCRKCQAVLPSSPRPEPEPVAAVPATIEPTQEAVQPENNRVNNGYAAMLNGIRSWGMWSLGLGALHIFTSNFLSAPWGILLIIVGLASFYFKSASMFVIYSITLGWAALSNLLGFETAWVAFALYQFYLAFQVFQQFRVYNNYEKTNSLPEQAQSDRAARFFPWLSSLFGCSSILGLALVVIIILIMVISAGGESDYPQYLDFILGLVINFGVLGAAIGTASLLSKYRLKALAITGLISGLLTVIINFVFSYL